MGRLRDIIGPRPIKKLAVLLGVLAIAVTAITASASQTEAETEVKEVQVLDQTDPSTPEASPMKASESRVAESEKNVGGGPVEPLTKE